MLQGGLEAEKAVADEAAWTRRTAPSLRPLSLTRTHTGTPSPRYSRTA